MRPSSCRWAFGGGLQVAVADPDSYWRQRHCSHTPHYAQQQSGRESERPRNRRSLLQGGPRKALFRSSRDWTWQLWCCIFCKYLSWWLSTSLFNLVYICLADVLAEIIVSIMNRVKCETRFVFLRSTWILCFLLRTLLSFCNVPLNRLKLGPKMEQCECASACHICYIIAQAL